MNRIPPFGAFAIAALIAGAGAANAATTTYSLPDIGTFPGYQDSNTAQTFTGNGFSGIYPAAGGAAPGWVHLFGLENYGTPFSETLIQVNLGSLSGPASSANLSFSMINGNGVPQTGKIYGFGGNGNLTYTENAPAVNYGSNAETFAGGANSDDVTNLVNAAFASGNPWLDLLLIGDGGNMWTYTYTGFGYNANSASASLTVKTADAVPEPASMSILGAGLVGLGAATRRRKLA